MASFANATRSVTRLHNLFLNLEMEVLPGDLFAITTLLEHANQDEAMPSSEETTPPNTLVLGPGLQQYRDKVHVMKGGRLMFQQPNKWWVDHFQTCYVPGLNDCVIGVVRARLGEAYAVDIGSAHSAILPLLAFEGATKRNRPNFKIGQLVYARVTLAEKDIEPEIACVSASTGKAEGLGELKGGHVISCGIRFSRHLMDDKKTTLYELGQQMPYELAIGVNGQVWINSDSVDSIMAVVKVVRDLEATFNDCSY